MEQEYIAQTTLDQMVGTDQGQLLKALIPYFPPRQQQFLSVFAKAKELSNTLTLFSNPPAAMRIQAASAPAQPMELLSDLRRYFFGNTRKTLDQINNMIAMVEMLRIMNVPSSQDTPKDNCEEERQ